MHRTNLPDARPLVGRATELARVRQLVDQHRLVTLTGPAGVGKTALACGAALAARKRYPAGAWLCELSDAVTVEDVCRALARALGVQLLGSNARGGAVAQLGRALADRGRVLVVLDNMEQLVAHAGATVGAWLDAAGKARFLVTSRERLRLDGEQVLDVGPLAVPPAGDDAVTLFVERARDAGQQGALCDADGPAIAELVRELDGLPLAIELAAARVCVLSPAQILERLPRRFELLTRGSAATSGRRRTLWDAIDASWATLSPFERAALAQSSVFRGGFSLDAAGDVLDLGSGTEAPPLVDVLHALRDKSLLRADRASSEVRFGLLVSIREFASSMLTAADAASARARHAAHFVGAARAWAGRVSRAGGGAVMARMLLDLDNLLAVVAHGLGGADAVATATAFEILLALEPVFSTHGPFSIYIGLLERASSVAPPACAPPRLFVGVLSARGRALCAAGRSGEAEDVLARAIALAEASGERADEGRARAALGLVHRQWGRASSAEAEYARALDLTDPADDAGVGDILLKRGNLELDRGRLDAAREAYAGALERLQAAGDLRRTGWLLGNSAILAFSAGEDPTALYLRSIEIARELGDPRAEAFHHGNLARLQQERGAYAEAHGSYARAGSMLRAVGDERAVARCLLDWGTLLHEEGRQDEAPARYREAAAILRAVGDPRSLGFTIACAASADVALGRRERAAADFDEAERLLRSADDRAGPLAVDLHRALARAADGDLEAARAALARVSGLSDRTSELRFVIRLLERAVDAGAQRTLRVGPAASWFERTGAGRAELPPGSPMSGLLLGLADAHRERPGSALDVAHLVSCGWPGERVLPKAGANRVRVALAALRKLGLREPLLGRRDGWFLDPAWSVVREG